MRIKRPNYKTCPRCKEKNNISSVKCDNCGLVFSRLDYASNELAKKMILKRKKDYVIYTNNFPSDLSKINTMMLSIFLGIFGAHCFYVGRYKRAVFFLICGLFSVVCSGVSFSIMEKYIAYMQIPVGIMAIMWLLDIAAIVFGKFKVPISIDYTVMEGK